MRGLEFRACFLEFANDVSSAHRAVLQVGSRFALEGQGFLEIKRNDDPALKLQQEVAQRGHGDLARVVAHLGGFLRHVARTHFPSGAGD